MAYNLVDRFQPLPTAYKLLEPGAYQNINGYPFEPNKVPFNTKSPRTTQAGNKVWTEKIYVSDYRPKIPNCTSLKSRTPRFAYESFGEKDLEEFLCRCGISNVCECPVETEQDKPVLCQGLVRKRLIIGNPPRSVLGGGLSAPSKNDKGFSVTQDGRAERIRKVVEEECPPFYDTRVDECSAFYQGCKWSRWTSKRNLKSFEQRPGPADYNIEKQQSEAEICQEHLRSYRRKTSKQLRFIEMIQQRNIIDNQPGPATYYPSSPRGTDLQFTGAKEERFPNSKYAISPGPADHWVRRDFDLPDQPLKTSNYKMPEPAFFGVKARRFKPRVEEGPSPASYDPTLKLCRLTNCSKAPFGALALRWKNGVHDDEDEEDLVLEEDDKDDDEPIRVCPNPSWMFKSKSRRLKDLVKQLNEPSPADFAQPNNDITRDVLLQYVAPFFGSDGRFEAWHDWMPVFGMVKTPGPAYYNLEKPKCLPAVHHGPLFKSPRFPSTFTHSPAPNEYDVGGGLETILHTKNSHLQRNIDQQHKFHWKPPPEPKVLSSKEKEIMLLNKCIKLLDAPDIFDNTIKPEPVKDIIPTPKVNDLEKPKLLRCFLYNKQIPNSI